MAKESKMKKARNYFNEEVVRDMLLEYQKTVVKRDKVIIIKDAPLEAKITKEVMKIVNAIIVVYRYYIFEDTDDLMQHGMKACYENFVKFDPVKGTAFNFFSIIAKISLLNYTDRRQKHRNHQDIQEQIALESPQRVNYEMFFDELEDTLFGIIDENFIGSKRKKYVKIASVIIDYLRKTQKFVSKSDLYSWARGYGIKNTEVREFIKTIGEFNVEIFSLV